MNHKKNYQKKRILFINILIFLLFLNFSFAEENFNLELKIPQSYKSVKPGEAIHFTIVIFNLNNGERKDINLVFEIIDEKGQVISSKTKTVAIETQASFIDELKIPENIQKGSYFLKATLQSGENTRYTQEKFDISDKNNFFNNIYFYLIILLIFLAFLFFILFKLFKKIFEKIKLKIQVKKIINNKLKK